MEKPKHGNRYLYLYQWQLSEISFYILSGIILDEVKAFYSDSHTEMLPVLRSLQVKGRSLTWFSSHQHFECSESYEVSLLGALPIMLKLRWGDSVRNKFAQLGIFTVFGLNIYLPANNLSKNNIRLNSSLLQRSLKLSEKKSLL